MCNEGGERGFVFANANGRPRALIRAKSFASRRSFFSSASCRWLCLSRGNAWSSSFGGVDLEPEWEILGTQRDGRCRSNLRPCRVATEGQGKMWPWFRPRMCVCGRQRANAGFFDPFWLFQCAASSSFTRCRRQSFSKGVRRGVAQQAVARSDRWPETLGSGGS